MHFMGLVMMRLRLWRGQHMNETLIGIVIGAFLTFLLSFLLERSKHNLLMKKHLYDIQREKLEDFYLLIENSIKFSTDVMTKMYILLHHGRENIDNNDYKRTADDFIKLTNTMPPQYVKTTFRKYLFRPRV